MRGHATGVNTGSGAYVAGSAPAVGAFVGRDQVTYGDVKRISRSGLQGNERAELSRCAR